ncbi:heme-dependent oxidative N-demethylase family protein [Aspergillus homomorphus CBS 101889]|uniref:Uncharacterized protein n=1 Tax=Aspergillus homomorphus (strain CBS 101889) TaxID=1450537 RepID=A0A395IB60_ASPHC|nr:hypothetical protein BO97DRAFT_419700 [Aspergillus homomorphus CBS 101889]RAL17462.1 hypothetical protein BO97DRAFT_419700 [Aspergillus homomorphus CBS 101889]
MALAPLTSSLWPYLGAAIALLLTPRILARSNPDTKAQEKGKKTNEAEAASEIEPLENFQWDQTEPLALRPFKPRYHITMGKSPNLPNLNPNPNRKTLFGASAPPQQGPTNPAPLRPRRQPALHARPFIGCFPNGFRCFDKFTKSLADIHAPVPDYTRKLRPSMDRYLSRLSVGSLVGRENWSVSVAGELFALDGMHLYHGEEVEELGALDFEKAQLRCERQVLFRLPVTNAIVFVVRTYM